MATSPARTDRWKALDFGPPLSDAEEPDLPVLVEYTQDTRVAVITLNRPHADNAITTAMGARLTEILETIAVRPAVRAVILTGAGQRAFSVGSDLRQRKNMTKEDWLRQRQDFDLPVTAAGTDFQQRVWALLRTIPYGRTWSYGQLAAALGQPGASRAVGLANGRNPVSIVVPCHRVVGSDGAITGYGGGVARKQKLLDLERGAALF